MDLCPAKIVSNALLSSVWNVLTRFHKTVNRITKVENK